MERMVAPDSFLILSDSVGRGPCSVGLSEEPHPDPDVDRGRPGPRDVSVGLPPRHRACRRPNLADPDCTVEARQEVAVARNLIGHVGGLPGLGVQAGLRLTLGSAGILGFALLSSRTVRDAITIALRYVALSPAFVHVLFQEVGQRAVISFGDRPHPAGRAVILRRA